MYYRGDEFEELYPHPDTQYAYANTPDSEIRRKELATGREVAESGFFGGGGFLNELGETIGTFATFFAPFVPLVAPTVLSSLGLTKTAETIGKLGGALRPITEVITTGGTTTGQGGTSLAPSPLPPPTSPNSPAVSSVLQQPPLVIYSPNLGLSAGSKRSALVSLLRPAPALRRSRGTRPSPRLSRAQQKTLSLEVRRLLQQ